MIKFGELNENDIVLEVPKDSKNGDFSTNIAMRLARSLHKAPQLIATDIKNRLDLKQQQLLDHLY